MCVCVRVLLSVCASVCVFVCVYMCEYIHIISQVVAGLGLSIYKELRGL